MMYKDYKKPAYEWLPDIPHHWQELFIQQVSHEQKNRNTGNIEHLVLSLSYGNIIRKKNVDAGLVAKDLSTYQIVDKNNIILRFTDLQNDHKSLRVGLAKERGIITSAYLSLRNNSDNLATYLYYLLHTFDILKGFYGMGAGVRQGLNWDEVRSLRIVVPPLAEQQEIADYLDAKCAQIDTLIGKKERLLGELEAYKKSLIYECVTGKREAE